MTSDRATHSGPCAEDEAFLDDLLPVLVREISDGVQPDRDALWQERPHLRSQVEELVDLAQRLAVRRPVTAPRLSGYTIVRELGRGGMGVVYLARHAALDRDVALKVLAPALALSPHGRRRFLEEARALARVRHENVVAIHDVVDHGDVCAFAMDLVEGRSLKDLLPALTTGADGSLARLEAALGMAAGSLGASGRGMPGSDAVRWVCAAVLQVARALRAVHQAGLVHRDVKPSNILVRNDGTPLLADFGLVRDPDTSHTQTGSFLGTLAYAAPEQIRGDPQVDAQADVYALGVTLYEALCGSLPCEGRSAGEMLRRIEAGEQVPLRKRARQLPRDLEAITTKAMDPTPARRYHGVAALAADLERFLADQPVLARHPGPLLRGGRWVRRHPALAVSLLVVLLSAVGIPTTLLVLERAHGRELARQAETQRRLTGVLTGLFRLPHDEQARETIPARMILERARERIQRELEAEPEARAELMLRIGGTYQNLGLFHEAEPILRQALAAQRARSPRDGPATVPYLQGLARACREHGRLEEAEALLRQSLDLLQGAEDATRAAAEPLTRARLGSVLAVRGKDEEARAFLEDAVAALRPLGQAGAASLADALQDLGALHTDRGRPAQAEPLLREALATAETVHGESPALLAYIQDLAVMLTARREFAEAEREFLRLIALAEKFLSGRHPRLALALQGYASLLGRTGRAQEAERLQSRAIEIAAAGAQDSLQLATGYNNLAGYQRARFDLAGAAVSFQRAVDSYRKVLGGDHPFLAIAIGNLAWNLHCMGQTARAEPLAREALTILRRLAQPDPAALTSGTYHLAVIRAAQGSFEEALELTRDLLTTLDAHPHVDPFTRGRALNLRSLILLQRGDGAGGEAAAGQALAIWQEQDAPAGLEHALSIYFSGWARRLLGDPAGATPRLTEAAERLRRLGPAVAGELAFVLSELGTVHANAGRNQEALLVLAEALAAWRRVFAPGHELLSQAMVNLATITERVGERERAQALLLECVSLLRQAPEIVGPMGRTSVQQALRHLEAVKDAGVAIPRLTQLQSDVEVVFPRDGALRARVALVLARCREEAEQVPADLTESGTEPGASRPAIRR